VQRENAAHTRYGNGRRANRRHTTALPLYKTLDFKFYFVIEIAKNYSKSILNIYLMIFL